MEPPEMNTSQLLLVSSLGLGVNLFGMFAMGGHHHVGLYFTLSFKFSDVSFNRVGMATRTEILTHMVTIAVMTTHIHPRVLPNPRLLTYIHIRTLILKILLIPTLTRTDQHLLTHTPAPMPFLFP